MENGVILPLAMLLLITETALTGANYQNDITVQSGPVEVKQGQNVRLWCKLKYDPNKVVPVVWHTPPNFKTRTSDCTSFVKNKYIMSCSDTKDPFGYYNMTIMDVQWADNGKYRCLYINHMDIVDLHVLVPVTVVTLKEVVETTSEEPRLLQKKITCTTNCAYPAPKISWLVNDQLFNLIPTVQELDCSGAKDGQKQTMTTVLVMSTDMDKERTEYNITCTADNVVGEPNVSEAIVFNSDELTGVYSLNDITVQPGPVEVKQGKNVSLWCKLKYDPHKVVPLVWHSPPNFKTRTKDCSSFVKDKYIMSCSDTEDPFGYYNMTIMDVQWADNGEYRCMYTKHKDIVDLQVLVPVTDVSLKKVVKSFAAEPQRLHEYLTCRTNCAFPAPKISWLVKDQPYYPNARVTEYGCSGAKEGQQQTESRVRVESADMDKERTEYNISCTAENVFGEPIVSKAITVNNVVPVTDVILEKFVRTGTETRRLHEYFPITCIANCASPRPKMSWLVNDQPFNGNATVTELGCTGAKYDQKQTMSTLMMVMSTDSDMEIKEYNITCTAENVVGKTKVSKSMSVNNDVPRPVTPSPPLHGVVVGFVVMSALSLILIVLGVSVKYLRAHKDYSSREARFHEHSAPPKYEKNDGIKYHNVSTSAHDFDNAHNEEGDLSRAVWSDARSVPRKRGKYNGINYRRVLTVAFEENIASDVHHEEVSTFNEQPYW
ncbi:hemicentin-2-like [Lineus longissimus]|uniref:hemicentin-2-like n=1 Tax=Lineus longissimus TaxID=88925 RepID=UPI00315CDE2D